jgi:hypothetical protein
LWVSEMGGYFGPGFVKSRPVWEGNHVSMELCHDNMLLRAPSLTANLGTYFWNVYTTHFYG